MKLNVTTGKAELTKPSTKTELSRLINSGAVIDAVARALPRGLDGMLDRLGRCLLTEFTKTPGLANCSQTSLIGCMVQAAQLGLEIGGPLGQAYLVPYGKEAQFQVGYRGLIALARRSGDVLHLSSQMVHEADEFDFSLGTDTAIRHKPALRGRGTEIGCYAVIRTTNGGLDVEWMSVEELDEHRRRYTKNNKAWESATNEMRRKTVLRRLLKRQTLAVDLLGRAMELDDQMGEQRLDRLAPKLEAAPGPSGTRTEQLTARLGGGPVSEAEENWDADPITTTEGHDG
jgi:recombination protein RecT